MSIDDALAEMAILVKKGDFAEDLDNFRKEVSLMSRVAHPHVVSLLAAHVLPPDYMLVMAMEGESVAHKLHQEGWRPTWPEIAGIALDLAGGLAAVHAAGILHRDIKTGNLLVGSSGTVKLGDFGIAELAADLEEEQRDRHSLIGRGKPSGGFHKRHLVGTLEYMAPEVLQKQPTTAASDVYAWAVTVNEIATGIFPFADCTKENPQCQTVLNFGYGRQELAAAVAAEGLRPILAPDTPPQLARLLEAAWQLQPEQRPTAAQLEGELRSIVEHCSSSKTSLGLVHHDQAPNGICIRNSGDGVHQSAALQTSDYPVKPMDKSEGRREAWHKAASSHQPHITAGAFETAGARGEDRMEDRHIISSPMSEAEASTHLLGIFDGHRGSQAAEFAAQHFQERLQSNWQASSASAALQATFLSLDASFGQLQDKEWADRKGRLGSAAGERPWPGATAIALLVHAGRLHVANAGDCRAVLCRDGAAVSLSRDHTADSEDERQRIVQAGGHVSHVLGNWRIGQAGIQVSRCLGDHDLKGAGGLTAEPEVSSRDLDDKDTFVVAASDGLWDCISNEEAVNIVHDTVKEPAMCAKRLATEALTRGSTDNITVVVAFLQPVSTIERIYSDNRQKYAPHQMFMTAKRSSKVSNVELRSADELRDTY
ncbi:g3298 [Coccomyxa viridis]|uniref:G3298 protein n=1 Tax=Coccomyxa viridis TaxID=1274662 RepID=A0ABP1FPS1_9CHLO